MKWPATEVRDGCFDGLARCKGSLARPSPEDMRNWETRVAAGLSCKSRADACCLDLLSEVSEELVLFWHVL